MKGKFKYGIQSKYPHMAPADVHLWEKFIRANPGFFERVDYDVPVGRLPGWLDTRGDQMAAKQAKLYQRKIDVVGYIRNEIWIVEVKPYAGSSALGQCLGYRLEYRDDFNPAEPVKLMVITNQCASGYHDIFAAHDVLCAHVGICSYCRHYGYTGGKTGRENGA